MRTKASHQNRFLRFITVPIRVLGKARDFYVRSMTNCAQGVSYGSMTGDQALPRSFSNSSTWSNSSEDLRELIRASSTNEREDLRDLIRAASARSTGNRVDPSLYLQQQMRQSTLIGSKAVPRSCSVGMGRIDEDNPCVFGEENNEVKTELMFPRSRSYAVTKRSVVFGSVLREY